MDDSGLAASIVHDGPGPISPDGKCPVDPDAAGVVVTYVFAAILTTSISIAAAVLDEMLEAKTAFLPNKLDVYFSRNQDSKTLLRCRFHRNVLDRLILSLADQQLVTGFALMLTGWIVYYGNLDSAHFYLIIYLSSLSSSSHLAALVTLRKYFCENPTLAFFRIVIISAFAILLSISIVALGASFGPFYAIFWLVASKSELYLPTSLVLTVAISPILWIFWSGIWQILPTTRARFQAWLKKTIWPICQKAGFRACSDLMRQRLSEKANARLRRYFWASLDYTFFLEPCTVFMVQIVFAVTSLSLVLAQKFSPGDRDGVASCSLNSQDENKMGYGQILALLMLALPAIATIEAYKEEERVARQHIEEALREQTRADQTSVSSQRQDSEREDPTDDHSSGQSIFSSPRRQDTKQRVGDTDIRRRETE